MCKVLGKPRWVCVDLPSVLPTVTVTLETSRPFSLIHRKSSSDNPVGEVLSPRVGDPLNPKSGGTHGDSSHDFGLVV